MKATLGRASRSTSRIESPNEGTRHPATASLCNDAVVRLLAIACVILAGGGRANAQVPAPTPAPSAPDPTASQPPAAPAPAEPPAEPPPPIPRQSPPPGAAAKLDRELAEQQCAAQEPTCDWTATLSSLERASVVRALAARGYELDPSPWHKVIGTVRVFNEDVFAERAWFLQFFNLFHVTTKESTILSEAVVAPGEIWDLQRIEETARRLRDPLWTSVVAVVPVRSAAPGTVDVLIVTRDIWSLRLNTAYTFQQGTLTNLATSLSENNFLGRRDVLAAALTMDQGSIAVGPLFIDKNLFGEHLDFRARVDDILTRDDLTKHGKLHSEGTDSTISLTRPLWTLASEWAAGASFTHRFAIDRQFLGTGLRPFKYTDPATAQVTNFGWEYEMRRWGTNAYVTRQWGTELKQQLSFGHSYNSQRPRPLDDFPGDAEQRAAFIDAVLPVSEVTSTPYVEYAFFTPRYRTLRNVTTFDLAEDLRTGPDLDVTLAFGLKLLGSDQNFQRLSSAVGWTFPVARDGFIRIAGGLGSRYQQGTLIDNSATVSARGATPPIANTFRILAQAQLVTHWEDRQNQFLVIGSDSGLRGFDINQFSGQRYVDLQVEARTLPVPIWVLRFGGVVFYDLGGADQTLAQLTLHHDVGLGLRILVPQTSAQVLKFDFPVPLDGIHRGQIRFLAGFGSEF